MAFRRAVATLIPRVAQPAFKNCVPSVSAFHGDVSNLCCAFDNKKERSVPQMSFRTFASESITSKLSVTPTHKIEYDEHSHSRKAPGTEGRPFAYLVLTGGRFVYASAARLAIIKVLMTLSAAADTMALSSLEVDLSTIEEGSTVTVKWRGKPVFIRYRTEAEIARAAADDVASMKDIQKDVDRTINPKYLVIIGICTHLGCVPIAGAGNYDGWFCPCHGSHYDISGRIREGPAPFNLEVPQYRYTAEQKIIIG
uniref:Cytochrome b-c1 complex subunit Rieske, mitochondrial n=1 Tax=Polytomella sp. Pringsheim 198.80 TaxID=37502 RepID=Q4R0Y2_9CHLO|nr:ubiquinol-cytochrome C reductase iron-sulfur subunit [Polytomella sp. Pringsheim 198.80]